MSGTCVDKKKTSKMFFLFLVLLMWSASAERNDCCPDKGPIIQKRCSDGKRSWAKICSYGAYILPEGQYTLSQDDDTIISTYSKKIIEKDSYCLGSIEDKSEIIAVICFTVEPLSEENNPPSMFAVSICCSISIACLSLTIIVYILLPKLRDLQGKCILITILNLLFAYIVLFILQRYNQFEYTPCLILAASMYFAFLSAFFWINIVAINIWRNTIRPQFLSNNRYIFTYYNIYGWGSPLIFLTAALITHHVPGNHIKPGWTEYSCWFKGFSQLVYFHIPILILMSINIVMFISVGWKIWKHKTNEQSTNIQIYKSRKYKCILYLKLFLIMGITWIFEPISMIFYKEGFYLWLIIDYVNALQGVIIFLLLVVFRKRVRRDLARRGGILCGKLPNEWALIPDAEMEELEDSMDAEEPVNEFNVQINQPF